MLDITAHSERMDEESVGNASRTGYQNVKEKHDSYFSDIGKVLKFFPKIYLIA